MATVRSAFRLDCDGGGGAALAGLRRKPVPAFGLAIPATNFLVAIGLLVFRAVAFQSVVCFYTGIAVMAGDSSVGIPACVMEPSLLVLIAVALSRRIVD